LILGSLTTYPLPVVQGRRFGIGQRKAHQWMQVLLVVLRTTLRPLGEAPTRSWTALAKRLGRAQATAAAVAETDRGASARLPPCGHDGTARRIARPQDPTKPTRGDRGKTKYHTGQNVRLINAALTMLWRGRSRRST
jgi:hypothetical protein